MLLTLLAHSDEEVQEATYTECHSLVATALQLDHNNKNSWKNFMFLMEPSILTEIICHGTMHENEKVI